MNTPDTTKSALRRRLSAARRAVTAAVREAEAAALAAALPGVAGTVCAYWPVGGEPGSPALLDSLLHRGCRVLLPVVDASGPLDCAPLNRVPLNRAPLNWAEYTGAGSLRAGPFGLREPTGPRLGRTAIAEAALILVPALAVDHRGVRLGRGGGYYDRTLPLAKAGTPLIAVVRDDEVLPWLPCEPHDVLVSAALTPGSGLVALPRPE
ncbi:MAG: 5-formyltetrahydrofolate cyclo-ligase [Pseudonocardiaceae bacterium]